MHRSISNWRPRTPFYYGWLILAISSIATFAASGLTQVVLGGIQVYITEENGWQDGSLAFASSLGTWGSGIVAPFIGRLADRIGPRWLMPFALVIAGVCYFILAGGDAVRAAGGEVKVLGFEDGVSTTAMIATILDRES